VSFGAVAAGVRGVGERRMRSGGFVALLAHARDRGARCCTAAK
jgi:hypothetical protein